ncbi:hypothetical protein HK103_004147 [Boothiomyces macroporosus]|uniref:Uncharacterized protein n=1 Tax=Boothiomyces macroporosus TaxID=261099 RepID=A0AAD5UK25_9FUNG|nr:hypothetical protein HK103_004147 [Boothiomyces macroporosus]
MDNAINDFETFINSSLSSDISVEIGNLMKQEPKLNHVEGERVSFLENAVLGQLDILLENSYFKETDKSADLSKKLSRINKELEDLKSQIYQPEPKRERYVLQTMKNYPKSEYTPRIDNTNYMRTPVLMPRHVDSPRMRHDIHEYYMNSPHLRKEISVGSIDMKNGLDDIHDQLGKSIDSTREILLEKQDKATLGTPLSTGGQETSKHADLAKDKGGLKQSSAGELLKESSSTGTNHSFIEPEASNDPARNSKVTVTDERSSENGTDVTTPSNRDSIIQQRISKLSVSQASTSKSDNQTVINNSNVNKENSFDISSIHNEESIPKRYFSSLGIQVPSRESSISSEPSLKRDGVPRPSLSHGNKEKNPRSNLSVLPQFPYQDHFKHKGEAERKSILKGSNSNLADTETILTPQIKEFIRSEIQLHLSSFIQHQFPGILGLHLEKFEAKLIEKLAVKQVKWDVDSVPRSSSVSPSSFNYLQNESDLDSGDSKPATPTITDLLNDTVNISDVQPPESIHQMQEESIPRIPKKTLKNPYEVIPQKINPSKEDRVPNVIHRVGVDIPDSEENAEKLLRKLRNKLNYKAKIVKELQGGNYN